MERAPSWPRRSSGSSNRFAPPGTGEGLEVRLAVAYYGDTSGTPGVYPRQASGRGPGR